MTIRFALLGIELLSITVDEEPLEPGQPGTVTVPARKAPPSLGTKTRQMLLHTLLR